MSGEKALVLEYLLEHQRAAGQALLVELLQEAIVEEARNPKDQLKWEDSAWRAAQRQRLQAKDLKEFVEKRLEKEEESNEKPSASKRPRESSDDEEDEAPKSSAKPQAPTPKPAAPAANNTVPPAPAGFKPRLSRVDVSTVSFHHERLMDNSPGSEATSFLQNRKMMAVKGKEFNKHKQKNKAKLYAAGVDASVRSFKFGEEEEE